LFWLQCVGFCHHRFLKHRQDIGLVLDHHRFLQHSSGILGWFLGFGLKTIADLFSIIF